MRVSRSSRRSLNQADGEEGALTRARAFARNDAVDEFTLEHAARRLVLQEERRQTDDLDLLLSIDVEAVDDRHVDDPVAVPDVLAVADPFATVRVAVPAIVETLLEGTGLVAGHGLDELAEVDAAPVALPDLAANLVSTALKPLAGPFRAIREVEELEVARAARARAVLQLVVMRAPGLEVAGWGLGRAHRHHVLACGL